MSIMLYPEELRAIILGKRIYKKCPNCFGTGHEWWEWDEELAPGEKIRNITEDEAANMDQDKVGDEPCQNCDRVGYVIAVMED